MVILRAVRGVICYVSGDLRCHNYIMLIIGLTSSVFNICIIDARFRRVKCGDRCADHCAVCGPAIDASERINARNYDRKIIYRLEMSEVCEAKKRALGCSVFRPGFTLETLA